MPLGAPVTIQSAPDNPMVPIDTRLTPLDCERLLSFARDLEDAGHPREVSDLQRSSLSRCQEMEDLERLVSEIVNVHRRHDLYVNDTRFFAR